MWTTKSFFLLSIFFSSLFFLINAKPFSETTKSAYFTLHTPESYANFTVERKNVDEILRLSFHFETRIITGQLLTIPLIYSNGRFVFTLFIKNGVVHARFGPEKDHRKMHWTFSADVADGKTHKASITLDPTGKKISLTIDEENKIDSYRHYDELSQNVEGLTSLVFGYSGKETGHVDVGFVGCLSNVILKSSDNYFRLKQTKNVVLSSNGCSNKCEKYVCPMEIDCVNFFSHYQCDCYKSGKEGSHCNKDSTVLSLDGTQSVVYEMDDDDNDLRIRRIGFGFKTFVQREQILFDASLNNMIGAHGRFSVALTKTQKIVFVIDRVKNLYEIGTDDYADGSWHYITVEINLRTKTFDVKVDYFGWMSIEMTANSSNYHQKNADIVIGGSVKKQFQEQNFMGCMKEVYINYQSILPLLKDSKLTFGCKDHQVVHEDQEIQYANQVVDQQDMTNQEESGVDNELKEMPLAPQEQPKVDIDSGSPSEFEANETTVASEPKDPDPHVVLDEKHTDEVPVAEDQPKQTDAEPVPQAVEEVDQVATTVPLPEVETSKPKVDTRGGIFDIFGGSSPVEEKEPSEVNVVPGQFHVHAETTAAPTTPRHIKTCQEFYCAHGAQCVAHVAHEDAVCKCQDGYVGETCLFSILPRSCDELYMMGERRNGVYRIDPVGSEAPSQAYVNCIFDETTTVGVTVVGHNFPNGTQVRAKNMSDINFYVVYKFLTDLGLKKLIESSKGCSQHMRYDCNQAPLQFMRSFTFFQSARTTDPFARIGDNKGQCPCVVGSRNQCVGAKKAANNTCNCDSSNSEPLYDEGDFKDDLSGINKLTFVQYHDRESSGRMTLSDLKCQGSKGYDDVVQFKSSSASLSLPTWKGHSLTFWFRTSNADSVLLSQTSTGHNFLTVSLKQGHILDVKFNLGGVDGRVESTSQKPVNNSHWHKVSIEHVKNYLRFSLNDRHAFHKLADHEVLDEKSFNEPLILGNKQDSGSGFLGCVRYFIEDGTVINLNKLIKDQNVPDTFIVSNCQDKCTAMPCKNNAECVEDYANVTYNCQCENPRVHLGDECDIDINRNSDISLHNPTGSYVNLTNIKGNNPVEEDIVFSFETDQPDALLLYAHDQDYNFIQVHLKGGNKITLTANYNKKLYQCTITQPEKSRHFNTMEWIQILIDYESDYLALYANKLFCKIEGRRILSSTYVETWDNPQEVHDVVIPPRAPFQRKDLSSVDINNVLFMGGVPIVSIIGRRNKRQTFYQSYLPNLMGALRGLRVGDLTINLQDIGVRPHDNSVRKGSNFGCDALGCQHGGVCTVAWGTPDETASCDCSMTSYGGPKCSDDIGVFFDGQTYVSFNMSDYLKSQFVPSDRPYDDVRFAFSSSAAKVETTTEPPVDSEEPTPEPSYNERLLDLKFTSQSELKLVLNKQKGHLHLAITDVSLGGTQGQNIGGSYADGNRHFVFMKFSQGKLFIRVDQQPHTEISCKLNLRNLQTAAFGGAPESQHDKNRNYTGCMSNAFIEYQSPLRSLAVSPLQYAIESTHSGFTQVVTQPEGMSLSKVQCSDFKVVPPAEIETSIVVMPYWSQPLKRDIYTRPISPSDDNGGGNYGIAIGLIVLLIVLLIILGLFLYYKKCRGNKSTPPAKPNTQDPKGKVVEPGENKPLIPGTQYPAVIGGKTGRHSHGGKINPDQGELPDADENLDKFISGNGYHPEHTPPDVKQVQDDHFPPPPTADEIRAMTPTVAHKTPRTPGTFTHEKDFYGRLPYVDEKPSRRTVDNPDKVPIITKQPSIRRQPKPVDIPKI